MPMSCRVELHEALTVGDVRDAWLIAALDGIRGYMVC